MVNQFAEPAAPLNALTSQKTEWVWNDAHKQVFAEFKRHMTEAPILSMHHIPMHDSLWRRTLYSKLLELYFVNAPYQDWDKWLPTLILFTQALAIWLSVPTTWDRDAGSCESHEQMASLPASPHLDLHPDNEAVTNFS